MPDSASIAALIDDVRPLIVAARERGERPRYVMLDPARYEAVAACRETDRARGCPMLLLGMEIVRADDRRTPMRVF